MKPKIWICTEHRISWEEYFHKYLVPDLRFGVDVEFCWDIPGAGYLWLQNKELRRVKSCLCCGDMIESLIIHAIYKNNMKQTKTVTRIKRLFHPTSLQVLYNLHSQQYSWIHNQILPSVQCRRPIYPSKLPPIIKRYPPALCSMPLKKALSYSLPIPPRISHRSGSRVWLFRCLRAFRRWWW